MVTVFHDDIHTCVREVEEKINSGGTTKFKSTEDAITDCLKEENLP